MLEISGALTGAPTLSVAPSEVAAGSEADGGGAAATRRAPIPLPATSATKAMTAIDATAHGSVAETRGSDGREPTAAPQRWQNFAPGESDERHAAHTAPSNGAPHEEQKRPPVDGALHEGQVAGGVIGGKVRAERSEDQSNRPVNRRAEAVELSEAKISPTDQLIGAKRPWS
jgi:hypothetical protein